MLTYSSSFDNQNSAPNTNDNQKKKKNSAPINNDNDHQNSAPTNTNNKNQNSQPTNTNSYLVQLQTKHKIAVENMGKHHMAVRSAITTNKVRDSIGDVLRLLDLIKKTCSTEKYQNIISSDDYNYYADEMHRNKGNFQTVGLTYFLPHSTISESIPSIQSKSENMNTIS